MPYPDDCIPLAFNETPHDLPPYIVYRPDADTPHPLANAQHLHVEYFTDEIHIYLPMYLTTDTDDLTDDQQIQINDYMLVASYSA